MIKYFIYFAFILGIFNLTLNAQSVPVRFNYQVSIRDGKGIPISDRAVSFRISILENPNDTFYSYSEVHNGVMTKFGTASLVIGNGVAKEGTPIDLLPFQSKTYHLRVELDEDRDGDFDELITTQLISVPYALVASQLSQNNAKDGQVLKWNENLKKWIPVTDNNNTGGGPITLSGDVAGNQDSTIVTRIQNIPVIRTTPKRDQVLKFDGSNWRPDTLGNSGSSSMLKGDVNGSPTNNTVEKIQGTAISTLKPKRDQYLKFDGSQWLPVDLLAIPTSKHYIGELFGGGIVFHVYNDNSGEEHGLIVSLDNKRAPWSRITNVAIGSAANSTFNGAENTIAIARQMGNNGGAAYLADESVENGYMDWYLPALDEWDLISQARYTLNKILESDLDPNTIGFGVNQFWTSTEAGSTNSWAYNFGEVGASMVSKSSTLNYRIIRKF